MAPAASDDGGRAGYEPHGLPAAHRQPKIAPGRSAGQLMRTLMPAAIQIENIEEMRRQLGIEDVELRIDIRALRGNLDGLGQ